jgi:hypothetical protein
VGAQPNLTRRHFLITGASALAACFLPADILRRARQYQFDNDDILIEEPIGWKQTLYANMQDEGVWQFSLGARSGEMPEAPSWRNWLENYEGIDVDDRNSLAEWIRENRNNYHLGRKSEDWLDSDVAYSAWENYLESEYAWRDSPEAQALDYLAGLKLANREIREQSGRSVGELKYYYGVSPCNDWHFAEAEGELVLPALQYRLRELGENTRIVLG